MKPQHFIGIDPGPTPGFVLLTPRAFGRRLDIDVLQCSHRVATVLLYALLSDCRASLGTAPALVQIEAFVPGRYARKAGQASAVTRDLIGKLQAEAQGFAAVTVVTRSAAQVKPWASDERLDAVGLLDATKGMRHAKDAARHALFAAVRDGGIPDPLSTRSTR